MYGVDELLKDSDDVKTEVDFKKFLGPTVGGEWQPEEKEAEEEKVVKIYFTFSLPAMTFVVC